MLNDKHSEQNKKSQNLANKAIGDLQSIIDKYREIANHNYRPNMNIWRKYWGDYKQNIEPLFGNIVCDLYFAYKLTTDQSLKSSIVKIMDYNFAWLKLYRRIFMVQKSSSFGTLDYDYKYAMVTSNYHWLNALIKQFTDGEVFFDCFREYDQKDLVANSDIFKLLNKLREEYKPRRGLLFPTGSAEIYDKLGGAILKGLVDNCDDIDNPPPEVQKLINSITDFKNVDRIDLNPKVKSLVGGFDIELEDFDEESYQQALELARKQCSSSKMAAC